jgi:hypothetical protein
MTGAATPIFVAYLVAPSHTLDTSTMPRLDFVTPTTSQVRSSPVTQNIHCWIQELKCDPDKDFLLDGLHHGFRIIGNTERLHTVHCHILPLIPLVYL